MSFTGPPALLGVGEREHEVGGDAFLSGKDGRENDMYGFYGLERTLVIVEKNKTRETKQNENGREFNRWLNAPGACG